RRGAITARSPGSVPGTNTRRPSTTATPSPSCVKSTIETSISARSIAATGRSPSLEERGQMRLTGLLELRLEPLDLLGVTRPVVDAADELEAQIDEIRVQCIRLAVIADARELSAPPRVPHPVAAHAELARQSAKLRDELERRPCARLIARQHVHQIEMPPVEAVHVVVEAERGIRVARFPVARRGDRIL